MFPGWISHPEDPVQYSLDGYLDEVKVLNHAVEEAQDLRGSEFGGKKPEGAVIPYAVLPSGPAGPGPFGAMYASLKYSPYLGPDAAAGAGRGRGGAV